MVMKPDQNGRAFGKRHDMKTTRLALAIILALASAFVLHAQTNTDSSGYVTNAALLAPFTLTTSSGKVITNAVLVKLMPNKFIYKTVMPIRRSELST